MAINVRVVDAAVHSAGADLTVTFGSSAFGWNQNDLALLIVKTAAEFTTLADAQGFVEETACRVKTAGTPGAAGEVGLQLFWKWSQSDNGGVPNGLDGNPVVEGSALNHLVAQMIMFSFDSIGGIPPTATWSPFDSCGVGTYASSTSGAAPGAITRTDNAFCFAACGNATDIATERGSAESNTGLSSAGGVSFGQSTDGVGGGFDTMDGIKVVAGSFPDWTLTLATASKQASFTICFIEAPPGPVQGLHPVLSLSPASAIAIASGDTRLTWGLQEPTLTVPLGAFDEELFPLGLGGLELDPMGWFDDDMALGAAPPLAVDAAIASITSSGLAAGRSAGGVAGASAVAAITAAGLAGGEAAANTAASAIAAITASGLAAAPTAGSVAGAAAISSATSSALAATATAANAAAAAIAAITSSALATSPSAGSAAGVSAIAAITAAPLAAGETAADAAAAAIAAISALGLGAGASAGAVQAAADIVEATTLGLDAIGVSSNAVAAAFADITSAGLDVSSTPGGASATAALGIGTLAPLAAGEAGANAAASGISAITGDALDAGATPGIASATADISAATTVGLDASPTPGAAAAAADLTDLNATGLAAAANAGVVSVDAAIAVATFAPLVAGAATVVSAGVAAASTAAIDAGATPGQVAADAALAGGTLVAISASATAEDLAPPPRREPRRVGGLAPWQQPPRIQTARARSVSAEASAVVIVAFDASCSSSAAAGAEVAGMRALARETRPASAAIARGDAGWPVLAALGAVASARVSVSTDQAPVFALAEPADAEAGIVVGEADAALVIVTAPPARATSAARVYADVANLFAAPLGARSRGSSEVAAGLALLVAAPAQAVAS